MKFWLDILRRMGHKTRILYIERKAGELVGEARIGRVTYSKTGRSMFYRGKKFLKVKSGFKHNCIEVTTGEEYWISGPKKRGGDGLYASNIGADIDDDVREEYWTQIRRRPQDINKRTAV